MIFSGQSGAGKTYTIIGDDKEDLSFIDYSPLVKIIYEVKRKKFKFREVNMESL